MSSPVETIPELSLSALQKENESLRSEVLFLKQQIADLKRMIYGSKSERFIPSPEEQLGLFAKQGLAEEDITKTEVAGHTRKEVKQKPIRNLLPAHLPREEEIIEPEGKTENSRKIGEEVTEILEYNPGRMYVRRIVRPKYKQAENDQIIIGELPKLPIPKGNAGAGLLAHLQVSKWVDHLPWYRQVQIFKREGVSISESTINGWFVSVSQLLEPLYNKLVEQVLAADYLQADESPITVKENQKMQAKGTGYHWVYHAPVQGLVVFDYRKSRSRNGPAEFLASFEGVLQTDGYKVYDDVKPKEIIILHACMAHARRYFEKALDNDRSRATYAINTIKELYMIERQARKEQLSIDDLYQLRQNKALPKLNTFKVWLDQQLNQTTPKSKIGKAIRYTLTLWNKLIRYTNGGIYHIDNNPIENKIRPLALGRKNYLFAGSHKAAQRAAIMYSFFATCKIHQVEPYAWLKDILTRLPSHKINKVYELLPQNWKPIT